MLRFPWNHIRYVAVCSLFLGVFSWWAARPGFAQACIEYSPPPVFDTSSQGCASNPNIDRSFYPGVVRWAGSEILVHSSGNDLQLFDIDDPTSPELVESSGFNVGNIGDSDHDLMKWAWCEDCRYGLVVFKLAAVIVDFGSGGEPEIQSFDVDYELPSLRSGITFAHGADQYVIADKIGDDCDDSGLYRINGASFQELELLQCLEDSAQQSLLLTGGTYLQDNSMNGGQAYIWASSGSYVHLLKVTGSGGALALEYIKVFDDLRAAASGTHQLGFDVDLENEIAVSVNSSGLRVWEVDDLERPNPVGTLSAVTGNIVSLGDRVVWLATMGAGESARTVDLTNPQSPVILDDEFWDSEQPWNDLPCYSTEYGGAFDSSGQFLFVSRWEQMQRFDFSACTGGGAAQPPSAEVAVDLWDGTAWQELSQGSGHEVFPGDQVRIRCESTGEIDTTELWLTDAADVVVAQSSGDAIVYVIPSGSGGQQPSTAYDAHVLVSNGAGSDQEDMALPLNVAPEVDFALSMVAPLQGDEVHLTAEAQGHPALPDGSALNDPFQWELEKPGGEPLLLEGEVTEAFVLDEIGEWVLELTVHYAHGEPPYMATEQQSLTVGNVAAAFVVAPTAPVNTEDITLDGSSSRWSAAVTPEWQWQYRATGGTWQTLVSCTFQLCVIPGSESAQTLMPGVYDFRLTLSDPEDPDPEHQSVATVENVEVSDGTISVDFSWTPANPEIGDTVVFQVTGLQVVDRVEWQFGGPHCDGYSQTVTCVPNLFMDCLSYSYEYATGGNKTVRMTATSDGQPYPTVTHVAVSYTHLTLPTN